jgi:hypothetical protein
MIDSSCKVNHHALAAAVAPLPPALVGRRSVERVLSILAVRVGGRNGDPGRVSRLKSARPSAVRRIGPPATAEADHAVADRSWAVQDFIPSCLPEISKTLI